MDRLTQKERAQLENVFSAIYTKKEGKFARFYRDFYSLTLQQIGAVKLKFKKKSAGKA